MKHLLLTTIAAVLLVGCGPKPPDISIHDAVEEGNIEAVKQHLAAGTDVNTKRSDGWTPLFMAISYAQKEIIELLIAEGANVNAKSNDGETPLHYVAFVGQKEIPKEIAELLIAKGADVNAKTRSGNTPLDVAIRDDVAEIETADLLRKHGGKTGEELEAEGK
jgi:cytohesin